MRREDTGQRDYDLREVSNGLRSIVKTAAPWHRVSHDMPPWAAVYRQTQRLLAAGCFAALVDDRRAVLHRAAGRKAEPTAASQALCKSLANRTRELIHYDLMTPTIPDMSRDRRIEDPTNLWIIHPAARRLLPWFIERGISANAVSLAGLGLGTSAALAYTQWEIWPFNFVGLLLSVCWLVADGLDGMIARATGTASPLGRVLDGLCDHGVFILIYVSLAFSIGTLEGWALAVAAGIAHMVQSNMYESERARFHRRRNAVAMIARPAPSRNPLVQLYDHCWGMLDRIAARFDHTLGHHHAPSELAARYAALAVGPMRLMSLLSANVRVYVIFLACFFGNPRLFWWFELVPLNIILIFGLFQHRIVENRLRTVPENPFPDTKGSKK